MTGLGLVCATGVDLDACFAALMSGESQLTDVARPWAVPPFELGAAVRDLDARRWILSRNLRRMNRLSRMAVVAAMRALQMAHGVQDETAHGAAQEAKRSELGIGVVLGTGLGALEDTIEFVSQLVDSDPALANPGLFPTTVMNVAASQISIELGLQGFNTTVNHKEVSGELALLVAVQVLQLGRADGLLCGGVDELSHPVHHGYRRMGGLAAGRPAPYGPSRNGVALGEGAAVLMLEREVQTRARGGSILAHVLGVGSAAGERSLVGWSAPDTSAPHAGRGRTASDASLEAGEFSVRQALEQAGLGPRDVDLVIAPGAGSPELDALDASVLARVFGAEGVPVTSPHGALGTWMASGALRLVLAVEVLRRGQVFPTALEGAVDPLLPLRLVTRGYEADVDVVLVCGHATGGCSAAAVLGKA